MGRKDKQYCQGEKPHPSHSNPQLGEITKVQIFSLSCEGFRFHVSHCNPQILCRRDKPLKYLTLKTNGNYVQENYRTRGSGKLSLNASVVKLTQPQNQCKNTRLKSTWTTGEVDPFINFEASAREAKPTWGASQVQRHRQEPLLQFQAALLIQVLAGSILKYSF